MQSVGLRPVACHRLPFRRQFVVVHSLGPARSSRAASHPAPQQEPKQKHTSASPLQWCSDTAIKTGLTALLTVSLVLSPPAIGLQAAAEPSPAHAGHQAALDAPAAPMAMTAQPGSAAAKFLCTPLTSAQRATFFDLHGFSHKISTSSPEAQALFDQGLLLTYDFSRTEAAKSFQAGLEFDPDAAMLHWGVAHAQGPFANKVWGPPPADMSYPVMMPEELQLAKKEAQVGLAAARVALAAAPDDPKLQAELAYLQAEHQLWDGMRDAADAAFPEALEGFARQMEAVAAAHPNDADAPALAAAARMDLSPWLYWQGPLTERTPLNAAAVMTPALLDITDALTRQEGHPLATHLMIHLTEAATPGSSAEVSTGLGFAALGEAAADALHSGPGYPSMGHLAHMPSHTYIRLGRWHEAVTSNLASLQAGEAAVKGCIDPYMPEHNSQMLLYAAMNSGELALAEQMAQEAVDFPSTYGPQHMSDGRERSAKALIQARFAKWAPLQQLQLSDMSYSRDGVMMVPPSADVFGRGVYHYVRTLALASAASHEQGAARATLEADMSRELDLLRQAVAETPPDPFTKPGEGIGIYSPGHKRLGQIDVLAAEARGDVLNADYASAADKLSAAIAAEAEMGYTEPPRQYQPMRQCLGWVLLQQGKLAEAEQAYFADLAEYPNSPWALKGLQQVYQQQQQQQGAANAADKLQRVEARLLSSWTKADANLTLDSSCPSFSD